MISVLVPSRKRAKLFEQSIKSLGKGKFDVFCWLDADDPTKYKTLLVKFTRRPRVGYKKFHIMINELAEDAMIISQPDWLMLWNDDALMLTPDWAEIINKEDASKPVVLNFFDPANPLNNLFPIISRPMYEAMGHFSLSTHCDSWVQDIANELGIHRPIFGIEAKHIREQIWDDIKAETQGAYAETSPLHNSIEMQDLLQNDVDKIRAKLS
jgi:hypothetical protein